MRLFVSVDLDDLAPAVARAQEPFRDADGLRLVDPDQVHVTLKFLGDTDEDELPALTDALAAAVADSDVEAFRAEIGGYGVFPSLDYISVVWLGVRAGGDAMTRLHEAIEARTVDLGFDPEDHDFTPHATIARMDHAGSKDLVQRVVAADDPDVGTLSVSEIRLTESILSDEGPEYRTVESFPLAD